MLNESLAVLVGAAVRVTIVLGAVWLATRTMRRAAASTRHFLWSCSVVAAALIPLVAVVTPTWQVQAPAAVTVLAPVMRTNLETTPAVTSPSATGETAAVAAPRAPAATLPAQVPSVSVLVMVVWAIGAAAMLLYLFAGTASAMWIRRSSRVPDARWVDEAEMLADAIGVRRPMFAEADVPSPMVSGFWRPCIVVPRHAASWPDDRRHVVLLHELAHIKRRDCLTQLVAQIVCGVYWFNPLVWIAARELRRERERACDDFVLAAGTRGSEYADHLLEIAQAATPSRLTPLMATGAAMARRSQLEGRLMAILDPAIRRSSTTTARLAAAAMLVAVAVPVAAVQLEDAVTPVVPAAAVQAVVQPVAAAATPAASPAASPAAQPANAQRTTASTAQPARAPIIGVALGRMLVEAVQRGNREQIAELLAAGVDVNTPVPGDGSALIAAAQRGHLDIAQSLLDRGADVNLGVPGDGTPLIAAAQRGHLEIATLLLDRGADIHKSFPGDGNPLIAASQRGHLRIAQMLLQRGARVDEIVDGDENALINASAQGHLNMVQLLVSNGANVNSSAWAIQWQRDGQKSGEWRTPLSMARRGGHAQVVAYLLAQGARE